MPDHLEAGPELDALFFETCLGWKCINEASIMEGWVRYWRDVNGNPVALCPHVTTDAAACEAWVDRWFHEQKLGWSVEIDTPNGDKLFHTEAWSDGVNAAESGVNPHHAKVLAAIAAKEQLTAKERT